MEVKLCMRCVVPKMLLFFLNKMLFAMLSFMYTGFLCVFYVQLCYTMLKLKLMKYILLCPSDIYSMVKSLQTGMSKNIVDPYQTAPKGKGH